MGPFRYGAVLLAAGLSLLPAAGASETPAKDEIVLGAGQMIDVMADGKPARLLISPGEHSVFTCTAAFAKRIGLPGGQQRPIALIGPVTVNGIYDTVSFRIGTTPIERPVVWPVKPFEMIADCAVGPEGMGNRAIRFDLRPPVAGERTVVLPYEPEAAGDAGIAYARVKAGDRTISVRFDLLRRETVATATAALAIAAANGGRLDGPVGHSEIFYGIERPIRRLTLADPLVIGPLSLDSVYARISDYGDARGIAAAPDPDELGSDDILVTGRKRKNIGGLRLLRIGADDLQRCSSIVFDRPANQIRLTCR